MKLKNRPFSFTGKVTLTFKDEVTGKKRVYKTHNLFVDAGLNSVMSRLAGTDIPANTKGVITYCAVGTGTNAPAAGNTQLQTEIERKQIAVRTPGTKSAQFRAYFNTSEAVGALKEIGLFGDDADGTTNSGTLFARAAIDKTKTDSESLTVDWDITNAAT
jgi:hypothetical protein